jgi:hypothetical protein
MSGEDMDAGRRLAELREISKRLEASIDLGERVALVERRRELRSQFGQADYSGRSVEELEALERALVAERESLLDRRLDMGAAGAGGPWNDGLDPVETMAHNRRVDESSGIAELEGTLAKIRSVISSRSNEQGANRAD